MTKPPLTPEEKEAYARRLKATLKTRRPRKALRLLVALVALVAVVALLWRFNRPPVASPPVLVACLDGVGVVGRPVRTRAWLKVVESPPEKSVGLTVHWQRGDQAGALPATKTDDHGFADSEAPSAETESIRTMQATLLEPEARYDRSRVFVLPPHSKMVIVPIAPMTGAHVLDPARDVTADEVRDLKSHLTAGWRVIYAATADDPSTYRSVRDWVRRQVQLGLPDGPVLLSPVADGQGVFVQLGDLPEPAMLWSPAPPK
jgi:hypothetical protein